jgi:hypothetical protein
MGFRQASSVSPTQQTTQRIVADQLNQMQPLWNESLSDITSRWESTFADPVMSAFQKYSVPGMMEQYNAAPGSFYSMQRARGVSEQTGRFFGTQVAPKLYESLERGIDRSANMMNIASRFATTPTMETMYQKKTRDPIGGAMAGASAGSAFGPWGAILGGIGGGILGGKGQGSGDIYAFGSAMGGLTQSSDSGQGGGGMGGLGGMIGGFGDIFGQLFSTPDEGVGGGGYDGINTGYGRYWD